MMMKPMDDDKTRFCDDTSEDSDSQADSAYTPITVYGTGIDAPKYLNHPDTPSFNHMESGVPESGAHYAPTSPSSDMESVNAAVQHNQPGSSTGSSEQIAEPSHYIPLDDVGAPSLPERNYHHNPLYASIDEMAVFTVSNGRAPLVDESCYENRHIMEHPEEPRRQPNGNPRQSELNQNRERPARKPRMCVKVVIGCVAGFLLGVVVMVTIMLVTRDSASESVSVSSHTKTNTHTTTTTPMKPELPIKDGFCDVTNSTVGMVTPASIRSSGHPTYSCTVCPAKSCASEVHIIAVHEPEGSVRGLHQNPTYVPDLEVDILSNSSHLPLTLVFSSYEATNWVVKLPEGVTIAHVFLMSYFQIYSSVRVLHLPHGPEINSYDLHMPGKKHVYMNYKGIGAPPRSNECNSCVGVDYVTSTMTSHYGCFTSFSGTMAATLWTLDLEKSVCQDGETSNVKLANITKATQPMSTSKVTSATTTATVPPPTTTTLPISVSTITSTSRVALSTNTTKVTQPIPTSKVTSSTTTTTVTPPTTTTLPISVSTITSTSRVALSTNTTKVTPPTRSSTPLVIVWRVDCSDNPCKNGAHCSSSSNTPFSCDCVWPYYGYTCDKSYNAKICTVRSGTGMAEPTLPSSLGYSTYSCEVCPSKSCENEVHIIAMYEPWGSIRNNGQQIYVADTKVNIVSSSIHPPLTLVLGTFQAVYWQVTVPDDVIIDHVILASHYLSYSNVTVQNSNGTILTNYELHTSRTFIDYSGVGPPPRFISGATYDCVSCKSVDYVNSTMTSQYGCFTSFSGRYVAYSWTLDLDTNNCKEPKDGTGMK